MLRFLSQFQADIWLKSEWIEPFEWVEMLRFRHNQYLRKKEVGLQYMEQLLNDNVDDADRTTYIGELKSKIVAECVKSLPDSCYKIISLFYYEQKNYDEIMEISDNYTSKDALKTRKYKCMEQLQKRIEERFCMHNLKPYIYERGNFK
ncbi:RNA polymerase sigma factor [Bacteroides thetaiotaomicron]